MSLSGKENSTTPHANYVGPYRLEKTLGKGQTGLCFQAFQLYYALRYNVNPGWYCAFSYCTVMCILCHWFVSVFTKIVTNCLCNLQQLGCVACSIGIWMRAYELVRLTFTWCTDAFMQNNLPESLNFSKNSCRQGLSTIHTFSFTLACGYRVYRCIMATSESDQFTIYYHSWFWLLYLFNIFQI